MKWIGLLILSCTVKLAISQSQVLSQIPSSGNRIESFIPAGYDTLAIEYGDLNKDSVADAVLVLGSSLENSRDLNFGQIDSLPGRIVVIIFRQKEGWSLAGKSDAAILCRGCGGIFGDPFAGVAIEKGVMVINHYGGSNWRWSYTHKFRFQQNAFYLIGQVKISYWDVEQCERLNEFAGTDFEEINFLTGGYQQKKVSAEGCKLLVNKKGKRTIKPLINLDNFTIDQ